MPQTATARKLAEPAQARPDVVIYLDAPEPELVERPLHAGPRAGGRSDDTEAVIRHPLDVFAAATAPLLAYYRYQDLARVVDATGSPDEITAAILALAPADAS